MRVKQAKQQRIVDVVTKRRIILEQEVPKIFDWLQIR